MGAVRRIQTGVLIGAFLIAQPATAQDSLGTKIGKGIRDAIEIAAPPIGILMDVIWPKNKNQANKGEVEALVKKNLENATKNLQPVKDEATDLNTIVGMLRNVTDAQIGLASLQARLGASNVAWPDVKNDLERVKLAMKAVHALDTKTILSTRDNFLRNVFDNIVSTNRNEQLALIDAIDRSEATRAQAAAKEYASQLSSLVRVAGYVFYDLNTEIQRLADSLKGGAAGQQAAPNPFKKALGG